MRPKMAKAPRVLSRSVHQWLAVVCCCCFLVMPVSAQGALSNDELDVKLDEIIEGMADHPQQAWTDLEVLRADAEAASNRELWADWNIVAAYAQQQLGDLDAAESYVEESLDLYRANGNDEGVLDSILVRGQLYTAKGRFREAIEDFQTVLEATVDLETEDPKDVEYYAAASHQSLGDAYTVVGDFGSALEHIQAAFRIYDELGDDLAKSTTIGILGNLYIDLDAADKALEVYSEGARLDRERGDQLNVAINLYNMGRALTDLGQHEQARVNYAESLEIARQADNTLTVGYIYYGAGLSFADEGRDDDAGESFEQAAEVLAELQDDFMLSKTRFQLAGIEARAGRFEASNRLLEQVLATMRQADAGKDLVKVHELFGKNYEQLGEFQLAYQHATSRSDLMQTLASEERARRTALLRVQFDSERSEVKNRVLNEENRLKAQLLEKERSYNRMFLIGVLLLLLVAIALSYSIWRQKELERSLTRLANTDDLTGLLNRRRLFEIGHHEVHRAIRYGHDLTVLVLDLDYFKKINDRYGHSVGDVVLRRVALHVAGGLREEDWAGRFGGEEFIAILPHTDRKHAIEVAERLREDVENLDLTGCSVENRLTISIGVAWLQGRGDSFQMMINRADAALYDAKAAGRNRVILQEDAVTQNSAES